MLRKLNLLLAILTVLVLNNLASAQVLQIDTKKAENIDVSGGRVPEGCPGGAKLETIRRDKQTGTKPSAILTQWMQQVYTNPKFPTRGYGVTGPDRAFYDSFPLGGCRVCAVRVTAQVENEGGDNDSFNVGLSPVNLPFPASSWLARLYSYATAGGNNTDLWTTATQTSKTLSINLNANSINQYIMSGIANPMLDFYVQDDTKVNWIQVEIWRY